MKAIPVVCLCLLCLLCLLCDCRGLRYNNKLEEPDCCGSGYILTPLGLLVYGPWETDFDRYNEAVYLGGKEISSVGVAYSPLQKDLVFELLQDGSVRFWYKHDYDSSLTKRTSPDASGVLVTTNEQPADSDIKKIYKAGTWKSDFKDSSLIIDFGKGPGIPAMKGRYKDLASTYFNFQEISYFDSTYLGSKKTLKKVNTIRYTHPWINKF
jgi:hypothetical protein